MSISILPARLANQIAAGEVVERPASVVKELVENSLDAGATHIQIDIEKGGTKRIRIIDNGKGIVENELTLALSRHATSKIKSLDDLEAISSLGFRGEALASISSVARLTLTSKPATQELAWQAYAEGRDMEVVLKPAAHPNGTTIDVVDLFFNTPARRKFLRTEKTEFSHIEEVIKRIALARFDVSFVLNHNGKVVKQYRKVIDSKQNIKRISGVCGQSFVDHAIEINCQHDDIHLSGWIAKPSYTRKQNDLCYSYVNGRMMRDKLINHAIRQAYGEFIDNDVYSAFVLFLSVDFKDVDVNVHPAKHEVRFHQSRYVHDFIYSVCHKALAEQITLPELAEEESSPAFVNYSHSSEEKSPVEDRSFVTPLQQVQEQPVNIAYSEPLGRQGDISSPQQYGAPQHYQHKVSAKAAANYQTLMSVENDKHQAIAEHFSNEAITTSIESNHTSNEPFKVSQYNNQQLTTEVKRQHSLLENTEGTAIKLLFIHKGTHLVYQTSHKEVNQIAMCLIHPLAKAQQYHYIVECWQENTEGNTKQSLISQPLLLPVKIKLTSEQIQLIEQYESLLLTSGMHIVVLPKAIQIRQFPALLRNKDVTNTFEALLTLLSSVNKQLEDNALSQAELLIQWQQCLAQLAVPDTFSFADVQQLYKALLSVKTLSRASLNSLLDLNSAVFDLTLLVSQLDNQLANTSTENLLS